MFAVQSHFKLHGARSVALSTTILLTLLAAPAMAQDSLTWDGGNGAANAPQGGDGNWAQNDGNGLWQDLPNAQTDQDFQANDAARFVGPAPYTVDLVGTVTTGNIRLAVDGVTISDADGLDTLNVGGNIAVNNAGQTGTISANIGTGAAVVGAGNLNLSGTVAGTVAMSGSGTTTITNTVNALDNNSGTTIVSTGGTVTTTTTVDGGTVNVAGGTLTGLSTVNAGGTLDIDTGTVGAVTNNGGTVTIDGGTTASLLNTTGNTTINAGTISGLTDIDGGTFTMLGGTVNAVDNAGTFAIINSQTVLGSFTNTGTLDATGAASPLTFTANGFTSSGDIDTNGTDTVTITSGTITLNAGATFDGANDLDGSVILNGAITNNADIDVTGPLTLAGTLNNTNRIDVSSTITGAGNNIANSGRFNVLAGGGVNGIGTFSNQTGGNLNIAAGTTLTATNTINQTGATAIINGTLGGTLNNVGTTNLTGDVTGNVTNAGDLNINGGSLNGLDNNTGGDVDIAGTGATVDTTITNAGALDVNAGTLTVTGNSTTNENGGTLNIANGATLASNTTNNTGGTVGLTGTLTGTLGNAGATTVAATGIVTGVVTNTGNLDINGGRLGGLDNNTGGDVDVVGGGLIDTTVTNAAALDINSGTLTVTGNSTINETGGTLGIAAGATLASNTTNNAGGTLGVNGTLSGALGNAGTTNLAGDVTGAVTNTGDLNINGGSMNALDNNTGGDVDVVGGGLIDTTVTNAAAFDINSGTLTITGNSFTNESGGMLTVAAGSTLASNTVNDAGGTASVAGTVTGTFGNAGTTNLTGTVTGTLTNTGALNVAGAAATVGGNLAGTSGVINLQDGVATTQLNVAGNANLNGLVQLDADLSDGSTNADTIAVGGNLSGTVALAFANVGGTGNIANVDIFTYGGANTLTFSSITGLPDTAAFEYFTQDNGAGAIQLQSRVNTGIANLAATVGLTQTLVDAIINRPTSPFVSDLAGDKTSKPCGAGGWARVTGGTADADGTFTDQASGQSGTSPVSLNYSGLQLGGDFACFDGYYNGWDLAFGGLLGANQGTATNNVFDIDINTGQPTSTLLSVTETDIMQRYAGVYATAARGRFFADLQYRYELTDFESTNFEVVTNRGFDLNNEEYENTGQTISGAVGYSWPVGDNPGLSFISSAGFSFTNNETDDINLGADGTLVIADSESRIGFASATLAKSRVLPDNVSVLSYFGTATVYNDFADDRQAIFTPAGGGTPRNLTIANVGSYAELSAGLNYVRLLSPGDAGNARQLNAAVRLDARFGEDVDSYALTGQIRLQF